MDVIYQVFIDGLRPFYHLKIKEEMKAQTDLLTFGETHFLRKAMICNAMAPH